jgi:very-short-patch-repair endonuclease
MIGSWTHLRSWTSWQKARHEAETLGLGPVVARLESFEGDSLDLKALFERSFRRALLFAIIESEQTLRDFFGPEHEERIERFRALDEKVSELAREVIRARLCARVPREQLEAEDPRAELGFLRKEVGKKTGHMAVRQLLNRIPQLLPRLKPCVLMSPLSVAQYLEASHKAFDLVIFDEASQIPVWDSVVGAIARGTQLIVVGDPKQLPPTNFFNASEGADEETVVEQEDLESILDELLTQGLRHKRLQWHYRSRHEGLIAFSNRHYYENDLLTFPSPHTELGGVRFVYLPDARYDKGDTRTNPKEARALVTELVQRLRKAGEKRSFGVVTFSQAQQELIENLLDEERRKHPDIESHFGEAPPVEGEPVFVKSLESVQGDERDVILFSIGYGLDETGSVSMNFGPLNREGGERRLNVAITRAKHEITVFSGLRGDMIDLTRSRARGVRDLKHFLEYAERGPKALTAPKNAPNASPADSGFEQLVENALRAHGYEVHRHVGCSAYRVDLAVLDPDEPSRYVLGIECDGPTYGTAATARDRDKLRQSILEGLGWNVQHIWSTDWWHDPEQQTKKLIDRLKALKGSSRTEG